MRPKILFPLFADVESLQGVGPAMRKHLERLGCTRIIDLLMHMPTGVVRRDRNPRLATAEGDQVVTITVTPEDVRAPSGRYSRQPLRIFCRNETGFLDVVFFNPNADYIMKQLPIGKPRVISGRLERFEGKLQMPHPDYIVPPEKADTIPKIEPIYPLTAGLTQRTLGKYIRTACRKLPDLPEWIEDGFFKSQHWKSWKDCMQAMHDPKTDAVIEQQPIYRARLAYDELLANQLALALTRQRVQKQQGQIISGSGYLRKKLLAALPFTLTGGQETVLKEIHHDMGSEHRMVRLLQGDVGSGKTVVALLAILNAIEAGKQAAFMAPTEILSRQHIGWITQMLEQAGLADEVRVALLTGKDKGSGREEILQGLKDGSIHLVIGTHALFQEGVEFHDLALTVIDEQHRFGVRQRFALLNKGEKVDMLLMTATPIPRTLTMTLYGDMEISQLTEKPAGRLPVDTRAVPASRMTEVVDGIKRATEKGERVYWICPLIEESEESDLAAAEERHKAFVKLFGPRAGLVHGRMKAAEKDKVMQAFKAGEADILVATTVVEVGVDVPEATIIVIEHAERFGLAQLHQLRGRVGRSDKQSTCILLYSKQISQNGRARLKIMRETDDGFRVAEEDLALRGSGELLGTRQSGMPEFKIADIATHKELLFAARDDVKIILNSDAELTTPRGDTLRILLYLFEYDSHIKYLQSG